MIHEQLLRIVIHRSIQSVFGEEDHIRLPLVGTVVAEQRRIAGHLYDIAVALQTGHVGSLGERGLIETEASDGMASTEREAVCAASALPDPARKQALESVRAAAVRERKCISKTLMKCICFIVTGIFRKKQ